MKQFERVQVARHIQTKHFSSNGSSDIVCNADMRVGEIRQFCRLQDEGQRLMRAAMTQLNLSARAYHRILKLARTIADLAGCEEIQSVHLAEALHLRQARDNSGMTKILTANSLRKAVINYARVCICKRRVK